VVEVDQTEMPLRTDDDPDTPLETGKLIVIGAVEVIDRATGQAQRPKALGQKYLDTLSGRIRLAVIPSNHAPPTTRRTSTPSSRPTSRRVPR
jgi:hypothetical protein